MRSSVSVPNEISRLNPPSREKIILETVQSLITIRRATKEDCRLIWEWRNEQATREASFNTDPIPYEEHERWFERSLTDPYTRVFVAMNAYDREVGYVRFNIAGKEAEISVSLDIRKRGKGYGAAMIRAGSDFMLATEAVECIVGHIKPDNAGSMAAFTRAGFVLRGYKQISGVDAYEMVYQGEGRLRRREINESITVGRRAMPTRRVLFRVDAGPQIGMGHLQRCMSLAEALLRTGANCYFLTNKEGAVQQRLSTSGFAGDNLDGIEPWSTEDSEQALKVATQYECDVVVVDSDCEGAAYLDRLRAAGLFVTAIEDIAPHPFSSQLVINGDVHAPQLYYESSSGDTLFLLGPEYSILRPEFWEIPSRVVRNVVENVLVTLGGADLCHLMPKLLALLDDLPGNFSVTAVVGPFFNHRAGIEAVAQQSRRVVRLVQAPRSVRSLMLEADLAISAAGQTLYELAAVGTPTVAVQVANNQEEQLRVLAEMGCVRSGGNAQKEDVVNQVGHVVQFLLEDRKARAEMSAVGRGLIDGQGAMRVAKTIVEESSRVRGFEKRVDVEINRTNKTG